MSEIHSMRSGWGKPSPSPTSATSGRKLEALALRRRLLRLAEIEGAGTQPDGAIERGDQLRHEPLHALVLDAAQAVGEELRARKHVAQIVADLAHGEAKGGEPVLLAQHAGELGLHGGRARARRCRSRRAAPTASMMRVGSSGRSLKRTMFQVSLVMGFTSSTSSER